MFNLTNRRVAYATTGLWIVSMFILKVDGFTLDWASLYTIIIAMFGLNLKLSVNLARVEQKLDDHIKGCD